MKPLPAFLLLVEEEEEADEAEANLTGGTGTLGLPEEGTWPRAFLGAILPNEAGGPGAK